MGTGIYVCGGAPPPPFWGSREPPGEVFRAMAQYGNDSGRNDRWYWAIALGLIITGIAAPVGILMIVMKMLNGDDNKKKAPQTAAGQQGQQYDAAPGAEEPVDRACRQSAQRRPAAGGLVHARAPFARKMPGQEKRPSPGDGLSLSADRGAYSPCIRSKKARGRCASTSRGSIP